MSKLCTYTHYIAHYIQLVVHMFKLYMFFEIQAGMQYILCVYTYIYKYIYVYIYMYVYMGSYDFLRISQAMGFGEDCCRPATLRSPPRPLGPRTWGAMDQSIGQ